MIDKRSYTEEDIYVVKGDTLAEINLECTDESGAAYDLTAATAVFSVKKNKSDATALIEKTTTSGISIALNIVTLESFDVNISAGKYYYDLVVTTADNVIVTLLKGHIIVEEKIS